LLSGLKLDGRRLLHTIKAQTGNSIQMGALAAMLLRSCVDPLFLWPTCWLDANKAQAHACCTKANNTCVWPETGSQALRSKPSKAETRGCEMVDAQPMLCCKCPLLQPNSKLLHHIMYPTGLNACTEGSQSEPAKLHVLLVQSAYCRGLYQTSLDETCRSRGL